MISDMLAIDASTHIWMAQKICYAIDKLEECNKYHVLFKKWRMSAKFLLDFRTIKDVRSVWFL